MQEAAAGGADEEVLEIRQGQYYILATSSRADDRTRVLKEGEIFAVFDRFGDVQPVGFGEQGLYAHGTRFLSRMDLRVGGRRPHLLSSNVREDNDVLTVDLTNADLMADGALHCPRGELHIQRSKCLWEGSCHERIVVSNFGGGTVRTDLSLSFDADFADIFEVRGSRRQKRGTRLPTTVSDASTELGYQGLDGRRRRTRVVFDPAPAHLAPALARFTLVLEPHKSATLEIRIECLIDEDRIPVRTFAETERAVRTRIHKLQAGICNITTSNSSVDLWLARARADLHMMVTDTAHGPFPYAGVPWFSTPFGRDSIITALECLWIDPSLTAGVLRFLAAAQATEVDPRKDAQPGKILHEMRGGEMAALGEVPFGCYYGSVDSTPLFLLLAGEYFQRTGDQDLIDEIWPNLMAALEWVDTYGDPDGDGFVDYARQNPTGLVQQGWKDSSDSIFHADGRIARAPIALCEVQAYVYRARLHLAELAARRGLDSLAARLRSQSQKLFSDFRQHFWCEDLGTYALALDGDKRPCRVRSSNAGHVLFAGLAGPAEAQQVAAQLMSPDSFSGWGIRTIPVREARYNPMSYHNGSIWPHDNALIGAGFARYGLGAQVVKLFSAMLRASTFFDLNRMPELFCGFSAREGEGPTLYPVACAPQAWAAAAPYLLLAACLGVSVNGADKTVSFTRPALPASIAEMRIEGLKVAEDAQLDLLLERHEHDVGITVLRREGPVRVLVER